MARVVSAFRPPMRGRVPSVGLYPMIVRFGFLIALMLIGAISAAAFARRRETIEPHRLARGYLVGVAILMGLRVTAYVAANVFGASVVRRISTGPFDPTNVLIGALCAVAAVHAVRGGFAAFLRDANVLLALRLATGVAFVLAGLVNAFLADGGVDYFVRMGYSTTFRRFIMTAEVLGGAALLLPWRWLTLTAAAGLAIDMFGALYTQMRAGDPVDAAAVAMLVRLVPLAVLALNGRWAPVGLGALATVVVAITGATLLRHPA